MRLTAIAAFLTVASVLEILINPAILLAILPADENR